MKWIAKVNDGTLYIFTVNTGDSSGNAVFTVSGKIKFVKRINLGKDRMPQKIKNTTSSWSDGFKKNEVHIYTIKLK